MATNQSSLYNMTVGETVDLLTYSFVRLIENGVPFKSFPSVMLWGAPGVGKSQGVREIAKRIENSTEKKVTVTDVRLLLFNPVDLRGIPTSNADKTLAVWLKPKIFQMDESDNTVNILFLDEISAAPPSVQAAAYQITLDRTVGEHKLPENCIVIAAGNRITDKSVAYKMPKALANRLCHIEVTGNHSSWHEWAVGAGINEFVLGFLDSKPKYLMGFDNEDDGLAFATPRSWEMVSNIFNNVSDDIREVYPLIVGCIGADAAYELRVWREVYSKTPSIPEILSGHETRVPSHPEILFALSSQIVAELRRTHTESEIKNTVAYVSMLPAEFKNKIFSDFLRIKPIRCSLRNNKTFDEWFARSGREWNDFI